MGNPNLDAIRNTPEFVKIETRLERETAGQLEAIRALPGMGEYDLRNRGQRSSVTRRGG